MPGRDGSLRDRLDHHLHSELKGPIRWVHVHLLTALLLLTVIMLGVGIAIGAIGRGEAERIIARGGWHPGGPTPPTIQVFSGVHLPDRFSLMRFVTHLSEQGLSNSCVGFTLKALLEVQSVERYAAAHHGSVHGGRWFSWGYIWRQSNGNANQGITYNQGFGALTSQGDVYHSQAGWLDNTNYYGGFSPNGSVQLAEARPHRLQTWRLIRPSDQTTMRAEIHAGRPFAVGVPVFSSFVALRSCGYVTLQSGKFEFDHSMLAVAYDRSGLTLLNWWGRSWGCGGYVHVTWSFLTQYNAYVATALPLKALPAPSFGGIGTQPPQKRLPAAAPSWCSSHPGQCKPPAPLIGGTLINPATAEVHNVVTRDTGRDISGLINTYGRRYGVPPVAIAAMIGTESGIRQYAPRYGPYASCDVSFGLVQVTVCTAGAYGVGNGSLSDGNIAYVRNYLEGDPARAVELGTRVLRDYQTIVFQRCGVVWPRVYLGYNAGPGRECSFYQMPYGSAYGAYYSNFLPWYETALTSFAFTPAPPRPFALNVWCQYSVKHGHRCPSPRYHGSLSLVARAWQSHTRRCLGIVGHERWNAKRRVMVSGFEGCTAFSFPTHRGRPVKFTFHRLFGGSVALTLEQRCQTYGTGCAALEVQSINAERALYGIPPLTLNWTLGRCALHHAREMAAAGAIFHDPNLTDITSCWTGWRALGQNVGMSSPPKAAATQIIHQLMTTEPIGPGYQNHHTQMLDPQMTTIGVGFTQANGIWFEVQDFAG